MTTSNDENRATSLEALRASSAAPDARAQNPTKLRIIAVANQKGGVGKTTTSTNLAAGLARQGRRTLLVDLDPQANASSGLGIAGDAYPSTVYEVLLGQAETADAILESGIEGLDVIPSTRRLVGAELEMSGLEAREYRLRQALNPLESTYEFVIMDCPPSLGLLTLNALTAARSVLIPIQCEYYALEGLGSLMHTIRLVQGRLNPLLFLEGVLLTMYDGRLNLSRQVAEEARRYFGERVYETLIPRNVKTCEAPSFGKPVITYDPKSAGAVSYLSLAKEVIDDKARAGSGVGRSHSGDAASQPPVDGRDA